MEVDLAESCFMMPADDLAQMSTREDQLLSLAVDNTQNVIRVAQLPRFRQPFGVARHKFAIIWPQVDVLVPTDR